MDSGLSGNGDSPIGDRNVQLAILNNSQQGIDPVITIEAFRGFIACFLIRGKTNLSGKH